MSSRAIAVGVISFKALSQSERRTATASLLTG